MPTYFGALVFFVFGLRNSSDGKDEIQREVCYYLYQTPGVSLVTIYIR